MAQRNLESGLMSPAPSEASVAPTPSADLPTPRSHPLIPGSPKETALINYIDERILSITRRYVKSFAADALDKSKDAGYTSFDQVTRDLEPVLDMVWISATPSIQIPYILTLAGHFSDYMSSFPFTTSTFRLARKFDLAFSSLLSPSPDNSTVYHATPTDKVRIRSLVEESRLTIITVASKSGHRAQIDEESSDDEGGTATEAERAATAASNLMDEDAVSMNLGKVYERTIGILGGDLASFPPPVPGQQLPAPQVTDDVEVIDL